MYTIWPNSGHNGHITGHNKNASESDPTYIYLLGRDGRSALEIEDVPIVELILYIYPVFTRMPGESYCRQLRSLLLYLC